MPYWRQFVSDWLRYPLGDVRTGTPPGPLPTFLHRCQLAFQDV